jgi:hypothetical protein
MKFSKRTIYLMILFGIIAVCGAVFLSSYNQNMEQLQKLVSSPQPTPIPGATYAPVKAGTANQTQTYTQLVSQYKDRRIQFDARCQAIPSNVTYKNGTSVMFDNRSGDARIITIGGVKYNFAGYGYKVITLSNPSLPKTLLLSCGAAVNVGQILLQK